MVVDQHDITTLAGTIGPRPPGSAHERRAAQFVLERFEQMDIPAATLPVRVPRGYALNYVAILAIAAISVPLARLSEILGLIVSLVALALLALEVSGRPALSRFAATRPSQNVLGLLVPADDAARRDDNDLERRVILSAHLDSGRTGRLWRRPLLGWLPALGILTLAAMIALPILQIIALFTTSLIPWYVSLVPLVILLAALSLLLQGEMAGKVVAGANDDASGVAALLAAARELMHERPRNVETWLLASAGAEAGMAGMRQFLAENRFDPVRTYFITLDSVGTGSLRYTRGDGLLRKRDASPVLIRIAGELARQHPDWNLQAVERSPVPSEQIVILAHDYQGLGVFAAGPDGRVPHWHQLTDTAERIDEQVASTAAKLAVAIIRRLDAEAGDETARHAVTPS